MYCFLGDSLAAGFDQGEEVQRARNYYDQAIKLDPQCSEAYSDLALLELGQGNCPQALALADQSVACKSVFWCAHLARAKALAALKRYKEALVDITWEEKSGIKKPEISRVKGSLLESLGRYSEAAAAFEDAYIQQKQDWTIYQIIHCLEKAGRYSDAIARIDKLLAINPADSEAFRARAEIELKTRDYTGAIKDLSQTLDLETNRQELP
jgi:tetratricopeptide (TPR) repeat protein